jgi:hypothetical protein
MKTLIIILFIRYRVITARIKRVATEDAPDAHACPPENPELADSFKGILGTRR